MRIKTLGHVLSLAGLLIATTARADDTATASPSNLLSPTLQATDADAAWSELRNVSKPPPSPPEWAVTPPSNQAKDAFYLPYVRALAGKAKDFYTRFPKGEHAAEAQVLEYKFLSLTVQWGDASQEPRLEAVEKMALNNEAIPAQNRVGILQSVAQNSPPEKARPLLQEIAGGSASPELKAAATEQLQKLKALGQPVALHFTAVDGRSVDIARLKGKVVLVDFWATWCPPCVGEVPNVKKTYDQFHSKGFEIVGISLDKEKDKLTQFTTDHKMEWPQFFDGQFWQNKYARQFGIESIPTMWLIDKKGNLRDMNAREDLNGGVQKLLAE